MGSCLQWCDWGLYLRATPSPSAANFLTSLPPTPCLFVASLYLGFGGSEGHRATVWGVIVHEGGVG